MCFRFYADFTGADPRCRETAPPKQPKPSCPTDGATPAWEAKPEPLRSAS
jgi:hypothetical protein